MSIKSLIQTIILLVIFVILGGVYLKYFSFKETVTVSEETNKLQNKKDLSNSDIIASKSNNVSNNIEYITYDNVDPTLLSPRILLTTNANYSNMFKVGETAYINFVVDNESIYTPTVNIGGFDNTTITGGPSSWKAEYTYNDNTTPDNDSVGVSINIVDLAGNVNSYNGDNTVIFDKTIRSLDPITIISNNPVRNIVQGGQTHHYAKLNDNITLEFESDETIIVHYVSIGIDNVSSNIIQPQDSDNKTWKVNYQISNSSLVDGDLSFIINFTDLVSNDNYSVDLTTNGSIIKYDKTAPRLDNVSLRSNNANKWMAKKNDTVTLEFHGNYITNKNIINNYIVLVF